MLARSFPAMAVSLVVTLGVLAIWPYVQDRFLTPVLPVLGLAGAFAVQRAMLRVPRIVSRGGIAVAGLMTAMLLFQNARLRAESVRGQPSSPYSRAIADITDWVKRRTTPNEHIMVSWGGAIYLQTGRRTSIPNPEEPTLGASVLADANRFYATRILEDSVDDVIIWDRAPGRAAALLRALATRCPGVMTEVDHDSSTTATRDGVRFYRVRRDPPCLVGPQGSGAGSHRKQERPVVGAFSIETEVYAAEAASTSGVFAFGGAANRSPSVRRSLSSAFRKLMVPLAKVPQRLVEPLDLVLGLGADDLAPHDVLEQLIAGLLEHRGLRNLSATT